MSTSETTIFQDATITLPLPPPPRFRNNFRKTLASYWGVDMRRMFHRNDTEALVDEEVSQFFVKDLRWEDNILIRQAEGFLSSLQRKAMIDLWSKDSEEAILRPQGPDQYEWTAKSKAPEPLQRKTWVELPGTEFNETFEARVAEFLNEITNLTIKFKDRYTNTWVKVKPSRRWRAFNREQVEKMRNPDIVLVKTETGTVKWADVISTIEVKWRDQPDLLQKAIGQLADIAALVFHYQPDRQWFPCLSLCGTSLRMSVFTRGGSLHTVPLDLHKDVDLFTKVMNYFTQAEFIWLGYDWSIFRGNDDQRWDPDVAEPAGMEIYQSIGKLFVSTGLYGKGTRVFAVQGSSTHRHAVIKDCWDPSETVSDEAVHLKLQDPHRKWLDPATEPNDRSERDFAARYENSSPYTDPWDDAEGRFLRGITIMEKSMQPRDLLCEGTTSAPPQSIRSISAAMGYSWDVSNGPIILDDRYRHRTLFKTCGVDILWFGTARELFHALAGAVVGHRNAYEKRDILHGDISDGNTLMLVDRISAESAVPAPPRNAPKGWTPLRHGMTSDWGSAADCREEEDKERLRRTGTLPFESNESLKGEPVEYHHDLQSYFWMAFLITCNCAGPFNMRRDWNKEMEYAQSGQPITPALINTLAKIKTQGEWKRADTDHAVDSQGLEHSVKPYDSIPYTVNYQLPWVRPGVHALSPGEIVNQRDLMTNRDFKNLMTPYFARHQAVRDGILELRNLFLGPVNESEDGFERRDAPPEPVTHHKMLAILRRIRDRIIPENDTYPDENVLARARERYSRSLKSGNRMPLMAEEDEEEERLKIPGSNKRASASESLTTQASKRGRKAGRGRRGMQTHA